MPRPPSDSPFHRHGAAGRARRTAGAAILAAVFALSAQGCRDSEDSPAARTVAPGSIETAAAPTASDGLAAAPATSSPATPAAPAPAAPAPTAAPAPAAPPSTESVDDVEARLDRMISGAASCASDGECRSVAVGGKACGGPTGYRAYSANGADPQTVEALASRERELATAAARGSGRVSNCLMLADPGARCEQARCVTGGHGPRAPATR